MSIGIRIRELRNQKRLTQAELGTMVGLTYVQIGRYEIGKAEPASIMLSKLAKELDTTADYLVSDDDNDEAVAAQLYLIMFPSLLARYSYGDTLSKAGCS
jgi:transcriptional regulator with XRE-family HTH domain